MSKGYFERFLKASQNYTDLIELLSFESEAPSNLKPVDSPPTGEEKVNGICGTLSTFLLMPKLTDGASAPGSFDDAAFSKPNSEPGLVDSFDGASAPVNSVDGTTLFPKLNRGGLATDPFGEVDLSEPKIVWVDALTAPIVGLTVGSAAIDEVIEVGPSIFSSTIELSEVLTRGLPSTVKLLDDIITDELGGISCTAFSVAETVFSTTAVERVVSFPEVDKGDTAPLG